MASREMRRIKKKTKDEQSKQKNQVEVRKEKHPILYAGSIIVFTIIAVSFIGSGLFGANNMNGGARLIFGKYNGKNIYYDQFNYFGRVYQEIANQTENSDPASIKNIWQQAFQAAVKNEAILLRAADSGYHVTEKAVDKALLSYPAYTDSNGNFDEKAYNSTDRRFRDATRELVRQQLEAELFRNDALYAHYFSSKEMGFFRDMVSEERAFKFVDFAFDEYPTDKVVEYGQAHLTDFRQIRLSRIILSDSNQADANQIVEKYNSGMSTFEDLAKLHSNGPFGPQGGDLGIQYYYQIRNYFEAEDDPELLANNIFNQAENTIVGPIQINGGWVIFRTNSATQNADLENEETIAAVREYITVQMRGEVITYIEQQAKAFKLQAQNIGFAEAAAEFGRVPVGETELFPLNYLSFYYSKNIQVKGDDSTRLSTAPDNKSFFEVAFALQADEVSEPVRLDDKIVVLQLSEESTLDDEGWELANGDYRNYLSYYNPPAFFEMVDVQTASYLYLYMANGYLQEEWDETIIDQNKFENQFESNYAKNFITQGL